MHPLIDWSITSVQLTSVFWFNYQGKTKTYFQVSSKETKTRSDPKGNLHPKAGNKLSPISFSSGMKGDRRNSFSIYKVILT